MNFQLQYIAASKRVGVKSPERENKNRKYDTQREHIVEVYKEFSFPAHV